MKRQAGDYLIYDEAAGTWREDPEQAVRDDVEKHNWLHIGRTVLKDWRLYLMLVPVLLVFLFWRYMPMYELLGAFKVTDVVKPVADQNFLGFSNIKALLVGSGTYTNLSNEFWRAMRNTFLLSFYGLLFGFPMPILLALFFNEVKSDLLRSGLQVFTYLPKFMSTVVMTSLVIMLIQQGSSTTGAPPGILSQLLASLGLISRETAQSGLLNDPAYFRAIYQVSGIWETAGYDSIVFFAAIIAISPTSYEAAQIDGANKWAQMTRIGSMLSIGYEKVLLLNEQRVQIYQTSEVISTFAWRIKTTQNQSGLASTAEMLNNVVGMLLVIGANTIARKASNVSLY